MGVSNRANVRTILRDEEEKFCVFLVSVYVEDTALFGAFICKYFILGGS